MTYQYIPDSDLDPGSPANTSLFSRLARNPESIARGDPSADLDLFPSELIAESGVISGGSTFTFSGLDLSRFRFLRIVLKSLKNTRSTANRLTIEGEVAGISASTSLNPSGAVIVDLSTGVFSGAGADGASAYASGGLTGLSQGSTALSFGWQLSGNFASPSEINLWGVK